MFFFSPCKGNFEAGYFKVVQVLKLNCVIFCMTFGPTVLKSVLNDLFKSIEFQKFSL